MFYINNKRFINSLSYLFIIIFILVTSLLLINVKFTNDMNWFISWIKAYADNGYKYTDPNYPPLFLHYLYLISRFDNIWDNHIVIKILLQLPCLLSQIFLILISRNLIIKQGISKIIAFIILSFIAFNPAFFMNSIFWGQVDIFPTFFVIISILTLLEKKFVYLSSTFMILAILTKFQMIAFFPLWLGLILNKHYREYIPINILIPPVIILLVFMPYVINDTLYKALQGGYLNASDYYQDLSLSASSIWIFISKNIKNHNLIIFNDYISTFPILKHLTYKRLGILIFLICNTFIFLQAFREKAKNNIFILAMLAGLVFYLPLTAMHERYIFYAVPMTFIAVSYDKRVLLTSMLLTTIAFLNMYLWMHSNNYHHNILEFNCIILILMAISLTYYTLTHKKLYFSMKNLHNIVRFLRILRHNIRLAILNFRFRKYINLKGR